jgi:hypothetical protein
VTIKIGHPAYDNPVLEPEDWGGVGYDEGGVPLEPLLLPTGRVMYGSPEKFRIGQGAGTRLSVQGVWKSTTYASTEATNIRAQRYTRPH